MKEMLKPGLYEIVYSIEGTFAMTYMFLSIYVISRGISRLEFITLASKYLTVCAGLMIRGILRELDSGYHWIMAPVCVILILNLIRIDKETKRRQES